jgi:glucose-6-phosphate isomerase
VCGVEYKFVQGDVFSMIDLTESADIPICLQEEGDFDLQFDATLQVDTRKSRKLGEMKSVLVDKEGLLEGTVVYKMYDGVYREEDRELFQGKKLRYDLTLMFPGKVGREFIKTAGHYHSISDDQLFTYPELYEVLHGEVHFILQKKGRKEGENGDAVVIIDQRGQRIVVPPDYGHVAVNPGTGPLVLANWIAEDCKPDYQTLSRYGGAVLYEIEENGAREFLENENYSSIQGHRTVEASSALSALFRLSNDISLYDLLSGDPDFLDWLRYPSSAIERFEEYIGNKIKNTM